MDRAISPDSNAETASTFLLVINRVPLISDSTAD
jgi:hypothetical protein